MTGEPTDVYAKLGVRRVINASGKMTALGGTAVDEKIAAAMAAAARSYVGIDEMTDRAGELIASYTGAEAACVTSGASSGIVQMVAACIAGCDPVKVERLPEVDGDRCDVLLQMGHAVSFGAPVTQMIRLGGGRPILIGWANAVSRDHLAGSISERTAAMLYVQSHHAVQHGTLPLADCIALCHERAVPVLVDAAAEEDLTRYIALDADAVTYSGGKAFGGPTSGFIAGRTALIAACRAQERGIARPMKVGKEQIVGLLTALEVYTTRRHEAELARNQTMVERLAHDLRGLPHLSVSIIWDEAGRAIPRVAITLESETPGRTAADLLRHLRQGDPPIYLRGHGVGQGTIAIDPRPLDEADVPVVLQRIRTWVMGAG